MIGFLIVLSVAAAVGNLGMMVFWYSRVRKLRAEPVQRMERVSDRGARIPFTDLKVGCCYRVILRGAYSLVVVVDDVNKKLCTADLRPVSQLPAKFEERFYCIGGSAMFARDYMFFKVNYCSDVTGCVEVTP